MDKSCFRLLMIKVKIATSFQILRAVGSMEYPTFKTAAFTRKLLEDDCTWHK